MNKIVIYTPLEEAIYSSGFLSDILIWCLCLFFGIIIVMMGWGTKKTDSFFDKVKITALIICATYTLHCGLIWILLKI